MKENCGTCHYAKRIGAVETGQINANGEQTMVCRFNPPTPIPVPARGFQGEMVLGIQGVHPPVRAEDCCGKWARRVEMDPDAN